MSDYFYSLEMLLGDLLDISLSLVLIANAIANEENQ